MIVLYLSEDWAKELFDVLDKLIVTENLRNVSNMNWSALRHLYNLLREHSGQ